MAPRETVWSVCPIVRDEVLTLFEFVDVGGTRKLLSFEKRILWLRESECEITLRHRGVGIDKRGRLNDYYGFLSSVEHAIGEVKSKAGYCKILRGDELTLDVDLKITDTPVLEDASDEGVKHNAKWDRKQYLSTSSFRWFTSDEPEPESISSWGPTYPRFKPREVESVKCIFTTATDEIGVVPERATELIERYMQQVVPARSP